eukprot:Gb_07540 [translate_table: standard]
MGTFQGHLAHGIGIMLIGLWHVLNTARNYASSPKDFESRPWFMANIKGKSMKHLELYIIIFFTVISITTELFVSPHNHQPFDPDWSIPLNHMNSMEHASISIFFFIYAAVALYIDRYQLKAPRGLVHTLGALAFGQELLLFHFHSTEHVGLEGAYHWFLQLVVGVSLGTTLVEAAFPRSAVLALVRSTSVFLQGVWLIHMAFGLWIPGMLPKGCFMAKKKDVSVVKCSNHEMTGRAIGLANLQFSWDLSLVILISLGILFYYLNLNKRKVPSRPAEFLHGDIARDNQCG